MPAAMSGYTDFNPEKDIPSLTGKVVVVTGGTAGIGRATVLALAKRQPAHLYFTGRNTRSAQSVIDGAKGSSPGVEITFVKLDMNSLAAVKEACTQFTHDRLDILMCNAGIMQQPPGVSVNGYERHFATNHLAHAMLIQQLLPTMLKTAKLPGSDVRLIMTTSLGWVIHPKGGILFEALKTSQEGLLGSYYTYGQSKLANIIYAREIARRFPQIISVSVHPGVVQTDLVNDLSWARRYFVYFSQYVQGIGTLTEAQGCLSQLWAAAGARKEQIVNGAYYRPVGVMSNGDLNKTATDLKLAEKLWIWTADVLSKY
ncbi:oxidoreductase [Truncatella angustata]|uniref:Oxidoreductase n=1 Tax=Truncatella angustata TaxID=152316 RepID=A0A9P8ZXF5_9PEZI|nr:oxidoreductase [Truncatella angustata]KAH6653013.1 oxidoreductase [Truncatella angustata]